MQWIIDAAHSHIEFSVKHLAITTVRGHFRNFTFEAQTDDSGNLKSLTASIDASSIDTNVDQRDEHLRSADFLDAANYPTLTFRSTRIERKSSDDYVVHGELTIRGISKPASFQMTRSQVVRDPWGNLRAGVEGAGKLNRKDWGLNWNQALEFGGVLVADEVKFTVEAQAVALKAAAVA